MKQTIMRGETIIGWITCPSESGASIFGLEVLAESVVDNAIEDNQFVSFAHAEDTLHYAWEAHCLAHGIPLPARPVVVEETNEQRAERLQDERDAEEAAYYAALQERQEQEFPVGSEQMMEMYGLDPAEMFGESDPASPERVEPDAADSDELPF